MIDDLSKYVEDHVESLTAWFQYEGDFEVELEYVDAPEIDRIIASSTIRRGTRGNLSEEVDEKRLKAQLIKRVKGWRGLNLKTLAQMININTDGEDAETEIPFSEKNIQTIMQHAHGFSMWVLRTLTDLQQYRQKQIEGRIKNSVPS